MKASDSQHFDCARLATFICEVMADYFAASLGYRASKLNLKIYSFVQVDKPVFSAFCSRAGTVKPFPYYQPPKKENIYLKKF